jgi:molecular chaperone GrpE
MTDTTTQDADAALDGEMPRRTRSKPLKGEVEQLRAESLRERADLDNQRKRLARDVEQARKFANERLLSELLPLFDSMEAGLAAARRTTRCAKA